MLGVSFFIHGVSCKVAIEILKRLPAGFRAWGFYSKPHKVGNRIKAK